MPIQPTIQTKIVSNQQVQKLGPGDVRFDYDTSNTLTVPLGEKMMTELHAAYKMWVLTQDTPDAVPSDLKAWIEEHCSQWAIYFDNYKHLMGIVVSSRFNDAQLKLFLYRILLEEPLRRGTITIDQFKELFGRAVQEAVHSSKPGVMKPLKSDTINQ